MPGDLVTSINGTPLDDPARGHGDPAVHEQRDRRHSDVERNGQTSQISINNAQVAAEAAAAAAQSEMAQEAVESDEQENTE